MAGLVARLRADLDLSYEVLSALKSDNLILSRRNDRLRGMNALFKERIIEDKDKLISLMADVATVTREHNALEEQNRNLAAQIEQMASFANGGTSEGDSDGLLQLLQELLREVQKSHQEYWELQDFVREAMIKRNS
jgi:seryl-tRNA synthetase